MCRNEKHGLHRNNTAQSFSSNYFTSQWINQERGIYKVKVCSARLCRFLTRWREKEKDLRVIFLSFFFPGNRRSCASVSRIHRGFDFDVAANNNAIYSAHSLTTDPPRLRRSMRVDLPVLLLHLRDPRCTLRARRFYRALFISIFFSFF